MKKQMSRLIFFIIMTVSFVVEAKPISNKALFRRCYSRITQSFPPPNHPLIQSVVAGTISPIDACLQVLNKANLGANGMVANTTDVEANRILNTFQSLHLGWIEARAFDAGQPTFNENATRDLYDIATPAYYYTRALFNSTMRFSEIFTAPGTFAPIRTNMNPTVGAYTNYTVDQWLIKPTSFVPTGNLIGIRNIQEYTVANASPRNQIYGATVPLYSSYGGGVLGTAAYINYALRQASGVRANAADFMPRKWSKALFHDFLCRDFPVVRTSDVTSYVAPTSSITFRQSETCVKCHATMDQVAGTIRNVTLSTYQGLAPPSPTVPIMVVRLPTTQPAEANWPLARDGNYFARPTNGRFVFRTYDGVAINVPLNGVAALGQQISQLNDPYVCAAKRYYHYFMGVDIPIRDFNDPDPGRGYKFSVDEQRHWNKILKLGLDLKNHQSARRLVEDILRMNSFREADFDQNGDVQ